ncbi:MAG: DUF5011 domain-containing protein [Ruminococcus sp.]|nr:DUF5011 domain-containing protein [Ruminococcus sp.]
MKEFKVMRKRRRKRTNFTTKYRSNFTQRRRRTFPRALLAVAMVLCAVLLVGSVCVLSFHFLSRNEEDKPVEVVPCVIENEQTTSITMKNGDTSILTVAVEEDKIDTVEFMSSDTNVLTVDSGGRVDAVGEGVATVTASGNGFTGTCSITVEKADKEKDISEYTTAIEANLDIVEKNKDDSSKELYSVKVNRRTNTVTVYTYDNRGDYVIPVRAMVCSCGENTQENITPTGEYSVYFKSRWHALFGDVYGQYVTGFSGHYLFHSVPYLNTYADTLKIDEFNKLGSNASQGCVRLMVSDTKWIYDNIDMNTKVEVIDADESADPLGKPEVVRVDGKLKWDPTDPASSNPYKEKVPVIKGAKDITIAKNTDYDAKVTAKDSCSNDITDKIEVTGNVITSKSGKYLVTYKVTDALGKTAEKTITVTVE